jgi:hypothetical protein
MMPAQSVDEGGIGLDQRASVHPIGGKELRALRRLHREQPESLRSVHIFASERLAPLSVAGYQRICVLASVSGP